MIRRWEAFIALLAPPTSVDFNHLLATTWCLTRRIGNIIRFDMHDRGSGREIVNSVLLPKLGLLDLIYAAEFCTLETTHHSTPRVGRSLEGLASSDRVIPSPKGKAFVNIGINAHAA